MFVFLGPTCSIMQQSSAGDIFSFTEKGKIEVYYQCQLFSFCEKRDLTLNRVRKWKTVSCCQKKNFPEEWRQFVFNWLHKEKVKKFFDMWSMHIHIKTYMKDLTLIWLYNILCKHKVFIAQVQVLKIPCLPCNFEVDCILKMNFKKTTNLLNNHQTNSAQLTPQWLVGRFKRFFKLKLYGLKAEFLS